MLKAGKLEAESSKVKGKTLEGRKAQKIEGETLRSCEDLKRWNFLRRRMTQIR